jgi:hypothetical protein
MNATGRWLALLLVVVLLVSSLGAAPARVARAEEPPSAESAPLADLLRPDGRLDHSTGFTGSVDPAGYRLVSGPGEEPRFAPPGIQAVEDWRWAAGFQSAGTLIQAYALAVMGSDLYVGGIFDYAGGVFAPRVAKWDGATWSAIGPTMGGTVFALAVWGSTLYVGGSFSEAGGIAANNIARYDSATGTWSALGSGVGQYVTALAVDGSGNLYAGGTFTSPANYVAKWDGTNWSALGSGMGNLVHALAVDGSGNLYAGGDFTTAGGTPANRVAKWDPLTSTWSGLGSGMSATVRALAVSGATLYAGGNFTSPGSYVAQWDLTYGGWSALGSGLNGGVAALTVDTGGTLYAGGSFGTPAGYVAQYSGDTWSGVGIGVSSYVEALAMVGTTLYAGGQFTASGSLSVNYIARWTGGSWNPLGWGTWGSFMDIWAMVADGSGNLYAGGRFTSPANYVAKWDGSAWLTLGSGMNNWVYALALDGSGTLYAGGDFTTAGGTPANRVAKWNPLTSTWSALGSGMNSSVWALTVSGSTLYAGGVFTEAGGAAANHVAKWDPLTSTWSALGGGLGGTANALAVDSAGTLYAGGEFTSPAYYLARWNGSTWSALGSGVDSTVHALAVDAAGTLYVGGTFSSPGNRVAKWNGSTWSALGVGTNGSIRALAVDGAGTLYAGGYFTTAGGVSANYVAHWDGCTWSPLGSGVLYGGIEDLAIVSGQSLYAGGAFTAAGGKPSSGIGRWRMYLSPDHWDPAGYCMDAPTNVNIGQVGRCCTDEGEYIWTDRAGDERTDADRGPDSDKDLIEFRVTADASNIYFRVRFQDITNADYPYLAIAVDTTLDETGQVWLGDNPETQVSSLAEWEREIVINLGKTGYYDTSWAWHDAGASWISAEEDTVEVRMPWSALGVTPPRKLRFTVFVGEHDGDRALTEVWDSDCLDAVTPMAGNTWDEVSDGDIDYYFDAWFDGSGEVYSPLLITGALVDGPGNPECEWVMLSEVAGQSLNLLDFKLGDEETKGGDEGMSILPDQTLSSASVVVASNWASCGSCGVQPTYTFSDLSRYSAWTAGNASLDNAADEVLLLDDRDTVLDAVSWGGGIYPGVNPHSAPADSHWLSRTPYWSDTNNCALDLADATGTCPADPTSVELVRFEGWPEGGSIHLQWETAQEIDNLGFNLYRANTRLGPRLRLNRDLIPTLVPPGSPFGAVYDWIDGYRLRPGRAYFYWLEDVDLYGQTTLHGPVRVRTGR